MSKQKTDVLLVSMPWATLHSPSIQIGILKALLEAKGFSVAAHHFYLDAAEYLINVENTGGNKFTCDDYRSIAGQYCNFGLGDWIFAVPPYKNIDIEDDKNYCDYLKENYVSESVIESAFIIRKNVGKMVTEWLEKILDLNPSIVGFTTSFSQNVPSLLLSKMLKDAKSETQIVFGGANCDGPMAPALLKTFHWIDAAFVGESEKSLPEYVRKIIYSDDAKPLSDINGLCFRNGENIQVTPQNSEPVSMDEVPMPDYDDYFKQVVSSSLKSYILPRLWLPFESARGCWWGAKQHCTFCGLNGTSMSFRSKNVGRVLDEILSLGAKYQQTRFFAVDNIISMNHVRDLLPELKKLRDDSYDFELFYETKVNLKKEQIEIMRKAGVKRVQPGIESLSTPILKMMRKGTTALQNIRFLKWVEQFGIVPDWNIIYGFPEEPMEEYDKMSKLVSALTHLSPPNFTHLGLQRFSPYHNNPEQFGLKMEGPSPYYKYIYETDDLTLSNLAYNFKFSYADQRNLDYTLPLRTSVDEWRKIWRPGADFLYYERGLNFLRICDNRPNLDGGYYTFRQTEAEIYLAADAGATAGQIANLLNKSALKPVKTEEVETFLEKLTQVKLAFKEGEIYLSLAIPKKR
jgi:ribosomal peptide maturation radical SAM protein 1